MSDEFEFITNASQIEDPSRAELPWETVPLKGLKTRSGATPRVRVYAITGGEYEDYLDSFNVYKDGVVVGKNFKDENIRFLYWCVRDNQGNHIWKSVDEAVAQIRKWPRPVHVRLNIAANKINALQADEAIEGNSDSDQDGSQPSDSAPDSESGTSTDS